MSPDPTDAAASTTVDVHWHHVPKALIDAVVDGSCPYRGTFTPGPAYGTLEPEMGLAVELNEPLVDIDHALELLDRTSVEVALASLAPPLQQYDAPVDEASRFCAFVNDQFAAIADERGGRLSPLADLPMQDAAAAGREARRAITELGLSGVAIGSSVNGMGLGDDEFLPFWEVIAELDAFVFVHGIQSSTWLARLSPAAVLGSFVGVPIDTAMSIGSLMFNGVFERFPTLKFCFSHGGGAFPSLIGRWEHGWHHRARSRERLHSPPRSCLEPVYCDSLTHDRLGLEFLIETVGEDHVLLGSDFPFDMGDADPLATVRDAITDLQIRTAVCGGSACGILGGRLRRPQG